MTASRRIHAYRPRRMEQGAEPRLSPQTEEFLAEIGWDTFRCAMCDALKLGPIGMQFCANCDSRSANRHRNLPNGRRVAELTHQGENR